MRHTWPAWFAVVALAACSGRTVNDAPNGGAVDSNPPTTPSSAGGTPPVGSGTPTAPSASTSPSLPSPYAACPDVFTGPVPASDDGPDASPGLSVLRARVLQSRKLFLKYAAANGNAYSYTTWKSYVMGPACRATINVTSGVVTSRTEQFRDESGGGWASPVVSGGDASPGSDCVPPVTMDALYDQCLTDTLCQDPRKNSLSVQLDARGLLVACGYFPANCYDDCYQGFTSTILTTDGSDWTKLPGCCAPSPEPACCMSYGGPDPGTCNEVCDGMPLPGPEWIITYDDQGCARWQAPPEVAPLCGGPTGL